MVAIRNQECLECVTNSGECNMIDSLSIATDFFVKLFNCAIVQLIISQLND